MPRISQEFKSIIKELPKEELEKIVINFARKNQEFFDVLHVNYLSKDEEINDLFVETKFKIDMDFDFIPGRVVQKKLAKAIGEAVKEINYFVKVTKNKKFEADLLIYLLDFVYSNYQNELGTCWTVFDSKLAITTNRTINLITKYLHEDYLLDYRDKINGYLNVLHKKCRYLNYVFDMPENI